MLPTSTTAPLVRQKALLGFAVFANKLGRTQLAHRLIEGLLREPPHEAIRVYVLVQSAINWQNLGSRDMAAAVLQHARGLLRPGQHHEAALVEHEAARQWIRTGEPRQALAALRKALRSYTAAGDFSGRCTALAVRIDALLRLQKPREAVAVAREGRREAKRRGYAMIGAARHIDEGRAQLASGAPEAVTTLQAALAEAIALDNASIRFTAHYWLWKAYEATDQPERARVEREAACSSVRVVQDSSDEVQEVRALVNKGGLYATRPMAPPTRRSRHRS
jgi:tetratricopeptide (TPR) repeat protein